MSTSSIKRSTVRKSAAAIAEILAPESDAAGRAKVAAKFDPAKRGEHVSAKPAAHVDQATVDAWLTALRGSSDAAVALFLACITRKVLPAQFVGFTEGSQKKTASIFNAAHKHATTFSAAATRKAITAAAKESGDVRLNVYTALAKQNAVGAELKSTGKSGAALHKAAEAQAAQAVADVKAKDAERVATRSAERATRLPAMPKANTLDAYAPPALLALKSLRESFAKLTLPKALLKAGSDYASAIDDAYDALTALNDR